MEPSVSNYIDVRAGTAERTSDFHDMPTYGAYYKLDKVDVESGPTSSACCAARWEDEYDGSGTPRITSGQRSIPKCKSDGFTSTLAKKHGIIQDCTPMDGVRR